MSLPKRFPDRDEIASVHAEAELLEPGGEADGKRRVAGRVIARREMGKLVLMSCLRKHASCARSLAGSGKIAAPLGRFVAA